MEPPTNSNGAADLFSSEYDGGDIIMLPGKKKKKPKNQVSNKLVKPKLSKSQKRKLKKLEEEKEKELLLSKSIETLEKYKIRENVYSLMWSSRNLGQVETKREKRRREVEFSKAGLELPESDRPLKKKMSDGASQDVEFKNEFNEISLEPSLTDMSFLQDKTVSVGENLDFGNGIYLISDGGGASSVQEKASEAIEPLPKLSEKSALSFSITEEVIKPMDMICGDPEAKDNGHKNHGSLHLETNLTTPTVIHVSRPKEVEKQRRDLPILMMEQEIMEAINENICVIICGETGCGKTTQVPQFLYEAGFGSKIQGGIIGVTQPRRVAVLATAKRVAFELGFRVGKEVGFQVRHDRRIGENCAIKIMTDGILLREVQNDFLLKRYSVIILDEAHARSLNTDILIGMLSRVILERRRIYKEQRERILSGETIESGDMIYPLKLILMSATLRVEDFVSGRKIFPDPPVTIEVPARQYPVTVHFSKRTEIVDYVGQAFKKVMSIHKNLPPGGILVFVTGQSEVEFLCKKLRRASREIVENAAKGNKNPSSSITEEKSLEENDMKEINEAYEFQGSSVHDIADRFGSNMMEEEDADFEEIEADSSYDSEESDLEFYSDDENESKLGPIESEASLASLRAAFLALDAKKSSIQDINTKNVTEAPGESNQSFPTINQVVKEDKSSSVGPMQVFPLYAMLPTSAHDRVFEGVKEGERLVVVATNVAETSLTIPGIRYVVDTGREKVKNYNTSNGMENYEIQWISKASAKQRTGRAGRTGPGHCYRLYSSAVYSNIFPDFSTAEILKVPVDGVVLLMKSMHIGKVANFPFPTPPDSGALIEAERCLKVLEALDDKGRLTPLGSAMGRYPMSPRHSRMLLTVIQNTRKVKKCVRANLLLGYAVASAAALSLQNPFIIQFGGYSEEGEGKIDKEEKSRIKKMKENAKISRNKFANPTSDSLSVAFALQCYENSTNRAEFCIEHNLYYKTMEEMSKLRKQLLQIVFKSDPDFSWPHGKIEDIENTWSVSSEKCPLGLDEEGILGQAICAGWADRVAKRIRGPPLEGEIKVGTLRYQACSVKETIFLHRRSSLAKSPPEFLVYSELLFSKRPYVHVATSVDPSWLVQYARPMCTFSAPVLDQKPSYDKKADQVISLVKPTFGPHLWELPAHGIPIKDDSRRAVAFAYCLLEGEVLPVLKENNVRDKMTALPAIMLKPEALGLKRVGNLLNKLNTRRRVLDSCAKLRTVWEENPRELFDEIKDWFRKDFHGEFMEDLWKKMQREVLLDQEKRFLKKSTREKKRI